MNWNELIGSKLIKIDEDTLIIQKPDGQIIVFEITSDQGDCCGFADVEASLLISDEEMSRNPVITKVEEDADELEGDAALKITLFGEYKPLASLDFVAGSGSGWCYGAAVTITCKQTGESDIVVSWRGEPVVNS